MASPSTAAATGRRAGKKAQELSEDADAADGKNAKKTTKQQRREAKAAANRARGDDDEHARASNVSFWASAVCAAADEWSADEHRAWANHFKVLLKPLEEAAATLPTLSVRDEMKGLAKRVREETKQMQSDVLHIKKCVDFMESSAAVPPAPFRAEPSIPFRISTVGHGGGGRAGLMQLVSQVAAGITLKLSLVKPDLLPTSRPVLLPTIDEAAPLSPHSAERMTERFASRSRRMRKVQLVD